MKIPKVLKVTYMGEPLRNIYPHASRFQVFKYKIAMFMRKVIIVTMIVGATSGVLYGTFYAGRATTEPVKVFADRHIDVSDVSLQNKISDLKTKVADSLMACESGGAKESDALVTYDPRRNETVNSNIASFGQFQFKKATVIYYYKTIYNKTVTPLEAVIIALDEEKARELAISVMFTTKNKASGDWSNCAKRLDLDKRIDLIKQLEK